MFDLLELLEFNPTELCNRQCSFCPRSSFYPNKNLNCSLETVELLCKQAYEAGFNGWFVICGKGEPLLHPDIVEICKIPKLHGFNTRLHTNGDHLEKHIDNLQIDEIWVSYYEIDTALYEKEKQKYSAYDNVTISHKPDTGKFYDSNWTNRAGSFWSEKLCLPCGYPFYRVLVDWNGDVNFCAHDWKYRISVDNIYRNTIEEIWNSNPFFEKAREELDKGNRSAIMPCNECSMKNLTRGKRQRAIWSERNSAHNK